MPVIAVVGAGAIGSVVATRLMARSGNEVLVATRTPRGALEVTLGGTTTRVTPRMLTDPSARLPGAAPEWVLVTTKAYDSDAVAGWFGMLVGPATRLAVLQNGVEHVERFAPYIPRERILPVVVDVPAFRTPQGRVEQHGAGELTVPSSDAGADFAGLFAGTGLRVTKTDDLATALWRKLCLNAVGAISAATLAPRLNVAERETADLVRAVVNEAVAVGRAEGATLDTTLAETILAGLAAQPDGQINSMHADRLAGRPMEIDARNGTIVRIGASHGIPTPVNGMLVALLRATT